MSKALYHIENEFLELMSLVEQADGELTPEVEEALAINDEDFERKAIGYFKYITVEDNFTRGIDHEINRLQKLKEERQRGINKLKKNLLSALLLYGEENPKTGVKSRDFGICKMSTRRNPRIDILEEDVIDTKYCDFSISVKKLDKEKRDKLFKYLFDSGYQPLTTHTISKTRIKKDIEDGKEVEGAYYDKENYSLTIK